MGKYPWPASQLSRDDMRKLYDESRKTGKPITMLIREAVRKVYGVEEGKESE